MTTSSSFRRLLAQRIFHAVLLTVPAAGLAAVGCTSSSGDLSGGAGTGYYVYDSDVCFPWPAASTTGAGGAGSTTGTVTSAAGTGGMAGVGGAGGSGGSGGLGGNDGSGGSSSAAPCPTPGKLPADWNTGAPGTSLTSPPAMPSPDGMCCYSSSHFMSGGRPFLVEDESRTAPIRRDAGDRWEEARATTPRTHDLTADQRAELAEAWMKDGLFEHASVASFGRFALELLAVGAPSDLLEQAHRAAIDEVRHARLCLGLASAYAGVPLTPAKFPFDGRVEVDANLATVAARAAREGCIGETLAAILAAEQLLHAEDPAVRAALVVIAEDEARHAELAWRTVAWALRTGGAEVRAAVTAVFAETSVPAPSIEARLEASPLLAHGRLSSADVQLTLERGLREVVLPGARALLAIGETATLAS